MSFGSEPTSPQYDQKATKVQSWWISSKPQIKRKIRIHFRFCFNILAFLLHRIFSLSLHADKIGDDICLPLFADRFLLSSKEQALLINIKLEYLLISILNDT